MAIKHLQFAHKYVEIQKHQLTHVIINWVFLGMDVIIVVKLNLISSVKLHLH